MMDRLQATVETLTEVDAPEEVSALLKRLRDFYDVDNAIYYALSLGGDRAGEEFGAMTYPTEWYERYEDVQYRHVDPVVRATLGGFAPVDWRTLDWSGRPVKRLQAEAKEFRVGNQGLSIPLHGPQGQFAMFSISKECADEEWDKLIREISQEMLLLSNHIHQRAMTLANVQTNVTAPTLSPRERDVLTLLSSGKTRAQIAERLEISENTLRVYLDSARHKLGAINAFHAVALGVKNGFIKV